MKIFKMIGRFFSKIVQGVKKFFKGKDPVTAVNDTVKAVVSIGTAGITVYALINSLRTKWLAARAAKNNKPRKTGDQSGMDILLNQRKPGTLESKLRDARLVGYRIPRVKLTVEDLEILKDIAKQRKPAFSYLTPERQMEILKKEKFDYDSYKIKWRNAQNPILPWSKKRVPRIPHKKPTEYWEVKDCGIFTPVTRIAQTFWHWLIHDPKPREDVFKKQIHVVNFTWYLDPILKDRRTQNKWVKKMQMDGLMYIPDAEPADDDFDPIEAEIYAEETFRYEDPIHCSSVIRRRMAMTHPEAIDMYDTLQDERNFREIDGYRYKENPEPRTQYESRNVTRTERSPRSIDIPEYLQDAFAPDYIDHPGSRVQNPRAVSSAQSEIDAAAERSRQRAIEIQRMTPEERIFKVCSMNTFNP